MDELLATLEQEVEESAAGGGYFKLRSIRERGYN